MPLTEAGDQYSIWVGLIYVFNLIVGTGALTLPAAFARAGWGLSTVSLVFLAFMSFVNATFVIETMACANAVYKWRRLQAIKRDSVSTTPSTSGDDCKLLSGTNNLGDMEEPLVGGAGAPSRYYCLERRVELAEMAGLFLSRAGRSLFYCTLCVYLYGDLSIYTAAVANSIMDVVWLGLHLALDYALISVFYLLLAFTGAFAFAHLSDLYTLNFVPTDNENIFLEMIEYFLALFPVFTLSTSFPIIAITLRNNLQSFFLDTTRLDSYNFVLRRLVFPIVTVVPPVLVTYYLEDIGILIEFTGAYAGTGIQYLMPTCLVVSARRHCAHLLGLGVVNRYRSPFSHVAWAIFVLLWSVVCIILVS
ncbi:putative amino acid transporter, partial [Operophtera brumata]